MKQFLIVKLGSSFACLLPSRGDFEDWIAAGLGVPAERIAVVDARQEPLPDPARFAGVVLTGGHTMVTDRLPWSEAAAHWTAEAVRAETPLLGICYGHQLLAHALGGQVGPNPHGPEFGTVEVTLQPEAAGDPLFAAAPPRMWGHTSHAQAVLRLPAGATCLASSRRDPFHAFSVGRWAWGVQFHPEFDPQIARTYIQQCDGLLRSDGQSPERLLEEVRPTPKATALLKRFAHLADGVQP